MCLVERAAVSRAAAQLLPGACQACGCCCVGVTLMLRLPTMFCRAPSTVGSVPPSRGTFSSEMLYEVEGEGPCDVGPWGAPWGPEAEEEGEAEGEEDGAEPLAKGGCWKGMKGAAKGMPGTPPGRGNCQPPVLCRKRRRGKNTKHRMHNNTALP